MKLSVMGHYSEANWLLDLGMELSSRENADFVLFTGGQDVSPEYYGQNIGNHTFCNPDRDHMEKRVFDYCIANNKKMIGVCRGLQALHAFQGFPLIQHMTGHNNCSHEILPNNKEFYSFVAPGDHHQNPLFRSGQGVLLGVSSKRSSVYLDGDDNPIDNGIEAEIIHYPNINALGFQYHPEWSSKGSDCWNATQEIFRQCF